MANYIYYILYILQLYYILDNICSVLSNHYVNIYKMRKLSQGKTQSIETFQNWQVARKNAKSSLQILGFLCLKYVPRTIWQSG